MIEKRLEKMENMLTQLIQMVGNMNTKQELFEKKLDLFEKKLEGFETKLEELERKSEERHHQLVDQMKGMKIDQDFIWEKAVRNEREIENVKGRLLQKSPQI